MTDRRRLYDADADPAFVRRCLLTQARHAIEAKIDFLQVRERDLEISELAAMVADIVALARGSTTRVLVNDRVDVAMACGAAGVHLRADSVPTAAVRSMAPAPFVIGRSVHTVAEAAEEGSAVDYLIAGTVWPSSGKPAGHLVIGVDGLSGIVRASRAPVLAIGGVTLDRIPEVAARGAAGVAAIGLFMGPAEDGGVAPCRAAPLGELAWRARARFDTSAGAPYHNHRMSC